jgi:hypothetical protein
MRHTYTPPRAQGLPVPPTFRMLVLGLAVFGVGACGRVNDWGTASEGIFPHGSDYVTPAGHGSDFLALGAPACVACHNLEPASEQGNLAGQAGEGLPRARGEAPSCTSCHAAYPHPQVTESRPWSHGIGTYTPKGRAAAREGDGRAACDRCHSTPGLQTSASLACDSCHLSWPHPTDWAATHGAWTLGVGSAPAACGACHGEDLGGGTVGIACTDCHAEWPHPAGYAEASGHAVAASAAPDRCHACHGGSVAGGARSPEALSGGKVGVACARCHDSFPHPSDWSRAHMPMVARMGEDSCLGACHGVGEGPEIPLLGCAPTCHGGGP